MHKNKRVRFVYSVAASFVVFLCIVVVMESANLRVGMLSKKQLLRSATESNIVQGTIQEMEADMTTVAVSHGLSEREWHDIVGQADFEKDYRAYLNQALKKGTTWNKGVEEFAALVEVGMKDYFAANGVDMSSGMETEVKNITASMVGIYKRYMQPKWAISYFSYVEKLEKGLNIALLVAILLGAALGIVLILQYHYKHRGIRFLCFSMLAATAFHIALTLALWKSRWFAELDLPSKNYRGMLEDFTSVALQHSILISGVAIMVCIVMIRLVSLIKHHAKN